MTITRCGRCKRRYRGASGWNATVRAGGVVSVLCPGCQTPEKNTEDVINEATLVHGQDDHGRPIGWVRQ